MSKKLRTLNFKIESDLLAKVNYYRVLDTNGAMSQLDFAIKALDEKCENVKKLRSGGMILSVPNPNMFNVTEEQKNQIVQILSNCANELMKINPGLSFGIDEIVPFAKQRLLTSTKEKVKEFEKNFYDDLRFEECKLDEETQNILDSKYEELSKNE